MDVCGDDSDIEVYYGEFGNNVDLGVCVVVNIGVSMGDKVRYTMGKCLGSIDSHVCFIWKSTHAPIGRCLKLLLHSLYDDLISPSTLYICSCAHQYDDHVIAILFRTFSTLHVNVSFDTVELAAGGSRTQ